MPSISRERVPGRVATIQPRDLAEQQEWQVLTGAIRRLEQTATALQQQVLSLQQQTNQPQWTVVQESTDYEFPAAFIRVELDASGAARVATLPLSDTLQGQLVNVAKSDSVILNSVTIAPQGTDALFIATGYDIITTEWGSVVLIAVPGGWSIFARSV